MKEGEFYRASRKFDQFDPPFPICGLPNVAYHIFSVYGKIVASIYLSSLTLKSHDSGYNQDIGIMFTPF